MIIILTSKTIRMNKDLKISQVVRKRIAVFLLLNFLFSTISFSLPQEKCDGMCSSQLESHECSDMVEMTCCDMMGMNNKNNLDSYGMEVTENSCDYEYSINENPIFIIPKIIDTKIVLSEIDIIDLEVEKEISNSFYIVQNVVPDVSPPIYLSVSSLLI